MLFFQIRAIVTKRVVKVVMDDDVQFEWANSKMISWKENASLVHQTEDQRYQSFSLPFLHASWCVTQNRDIHRPMNNENVFNFLVLIPTWLSVSKKIYKEYTFSKLHKQIAQLPNLKI